MKNITLNAILFLFGGLAYGLLEILWRGYTHWTMLITGGACFLALYHIYTAYPNMNFLLRCLVGSLIITSAELLCGCVVNIGFHMNVWDYSRYAYNLWGQICLLYSVLWGLLCIPVSMLCVKVNSLVVKLEEVIVSHM